MSDAALFPEAFHFLRPWLLAAGAAAGAGRGPVARAARAAAGGGADRGRRPHLRRALTVGGDGRGRLRAIDGAAAVFALAALGAAGAAGPARTRAPDRFAAQAAPAVVILKVARSMEAADVAPSRLERGKQEIRDVLDRRAGARAALVAYAGSARAVVPKTGDAAAMVPFLDALTPEVMPVDGDRAAEALALAAGLSAAATLAPGAARARGAGGLVPHPRPAGAAGRRPAAPGPRALPHRALQGGDGGPRAC